MKIILILLVIALVIVGLLFVFQTKKLKVSNIFMISGGVKIGKSFFTVYLAYSLWRFALMRYLIKLPFEYIFKKGNITFEYPCIVSNIPLYKIPHIPLTLDMIERKVNPPFHSILLLDECSLIADQYSYRNNNKVDDLLNERITLFVKLFGHQIHGGGYALCNSQSMSDLHYGFKRNISNYLWIHSKTRIPFFYIFRVKEMQYSEDNNTVNVVEGDVEDNLKWLLVPTKFKKYYDYCCYSVYTDNNPMITEQKIIKSRKDLKCSNLISFRDFKTLKKGVVEIDS